MPRKPGKKLKPNLPSDIRTGVQLVMKDSFTIRKAADRVKVPFQTCARYVMRAKNIKEGETMTYSPNYTNRTVLSKDLESKLVDYLIQCARMNYGLTLMDTRKLAFQLAEVNNCSYPKTWKTNEAAGKD